MSRHQQGWSSSWRLREESVPCLFQLLEAICIRWLGPFPLQLQGLHGFPGSLARPSQTKLACWEWNLHSISFSSGLSSSEPVGGRSPTWRRLGKASADAICYWFAKRATILSHLAHLPGFQPHFDPSAHLTIIAHSFSMIFHVISQNSCISGTITFCTTDEEI